MSLFNSLGNNRQNQQMPPITPAQLQEMRGRLMSDPIGFLSSVGLNVPPGVDVRNPDTLLNYLFQSGQVSKGLLPQAMQFLQNIVRRR